MRKEIYAHWTEKSNQYVRLAVLSLVSVTLFMLLNVSLYAQTQAKASSTQPGSVLVYNVLTSNLSNPTIENTRISVTNTHATDSVKVRLWSIDGSTGYQSSSFSFCLGPHATSYILASDFDPGIRGFVVATAINAQGIPINFNYLIGDEYVKFSSGHNTNLPTVAFAALYGAQNSTPPSEDYDLTGQKVTFRLDGNRYSLAPKTVALGHLRSLVDSNQTMLVVNSLNGDATTSGINSLGQMTGTLYAALGAGTPGSPNWSTAQRLYPLTTGSSSVLGLPSGTLGSNGQIPTGSIGWYVFERQAQKGISAMLINYNTNTGPDSMKGGHNLQVLGFTDAALTLTMPLPDC